MKRKCLKILVCGLTTVMLASGLTGCKEFGETSMSGTVVSEEISEEILEEVSEEVSESQSEEKESASQEPSSETKEETFEETPSEEINEEVSEEPAGKPGEEKPSETEKPSEEATPAYTVEAMSATMYAQRAVNVRKGPGTEYEKIGGLSLNQEVSVTGKASTGWYEISYNGTVGYVAGSYLGDEKVAEQPAPSTPATPPAENTTPPAESTPATPPASTPSTPPAESVTPPASTPTTPSTPSVPVEVTYTVYLEPGMLGLVNGHRGNNGVSALTWNSAKEQEALDRVKWVAQNYQQTGQLSHSGNPANVENLTASSSNDVNVFYNNYYNSPGHNQAMLDYSENATAHTLVSATCEIKEGSFVTYVNVMLIYREYPDWMY